MKLAIAEHDGGPEQKDPLRQAELAQYRAADPALSAWVMASAGTGKTSVLTMRILRLLLGGADPTRILCLTFTKAAAAEMANRLQQRLRHWAVMDRTLLIGEIAKLIGRVPNREEIQLARRLFAVVLDAPGGMKIHTIHAFCQSLLRRFPLEAGLAPHSQLPDETTLRRLLHEAEEAAFLTILQDQEGLQQQLGWLTAAVGESGFAMLLRDLIRKREPLMHSLEKGLPVLHQSWSRIIGCSHGEPPEALENAFQKHLLQERPFLERLGQYLAHEVKQKTYRDMGLNLLRALDDFAEKASDYRGLMNFFLNDDGQVRDVLVKGRLTKDAPHLTKPLEVLTSYVADYRRQHRQALLHRLNGALVQIAGVILHHYMRLKADRGYLDFDDQILYAKNLLMQDGIAPWILYKLDGGIDHILIDEAQDSNVEQWQLVQVLADEFFAGHGAQRGLRTLFAVGDRKQSIFRFQGAAPSAFLAMRRHFSEAAKAVKHEWADVPLEVSFRSSRPILTLVDAVFAQEAARFGVATPEEIIQHRLQREGQAGLVELWPLPPAEPVEGQDPWQPQLDYQPRQQPLLRLATQMAKTIRRLIDEDSLPARGRRIHPGDILILVRSRQSGIMHWLVRALKAEGVPVAGLDRMMLTGQLAVQDLMALAQCLLLPEDDLTLATVLKGPFIGLSEEALFELAHGRAGSLWQALKDRHESVVFASALEFLETLLGKAGYQSPFEFFAELLGAGGGRRKILQRLGYDQAEPMDLFLELTLEYEENNPPSLQGFLHWLRNSNHEVKRDSDPEAGDEVRIMTVHGAKGLEAPIVFLPDTVHKPGEGEKIAWLEGATGSLQGHIPFWLPAKDWAAVLHHNPRDAIAAEEAAEYNRLLYVALTRAADRLYVCGWARTGEATDGSWYQRIEMALKPLAETADFAADGGWPGAIFRLHSPQETKIEPAPLPPIAAPESLPPEFLALAPTEAPSDRPYTPSIGSEPPLLSPVEGDSTRFRRGLLLHRLLQFLPDLEDADRLPAMKRFLSAQALPEPLAIDIETILTRLLSDPAMTPFFAKGGLAEQPIGGYIPSRNGGEILIAGQIDRLLIRPEGIWILDFKSHRRPPRDISGIAPLYWQQMASYSAILERIYPGAHITCGLLWTEGPHLTILPADRLISYRP